MILGDLGANVIYMQRGVLLYGGDLRQVMGRASIPASLTHVDTKGRWFNLLFIMPSPKMLPACEQRSRLHRNQKTSLPGAQLGRAESRSPDDISPILASLGHKPAVSVPTTLAYRHVLGAIVETL